MMTARMGWPLWQPTNETLEAIAAVVAAHWHAARAYRERLFWPDAQSWLLAALPLARFGQKAGELPSMANPAGRGAPSPAYHFAKGGKLIK